MKRNIALTLAAVAFPVCGADVAGVWRLTGTVADVAIDRVCTIRQTESKIEGQCKNQASTTALTGEVKDRSVTWKYEAKYQDVPVVLIFKGALLSDIEIKGTISAADPDGSNQTAGSFSARRQ
jgi:hypothetical protein